MSEFVEKLGGYPMAHPAEMAALVCSDSTMQRIVVSAPGATDEAPMKMTDELIMMSGHVVKGESSAAHSIVDDVISRFDKIYEPVLDSAERKNLSNLAARMLRFDSGKNRAYYASLGEVLSAAYFANAIGGIAVGSPLHFSLNGELDRATSRKLIGKAHQEAGEERLVIPGFYGTDSIGRTYVLDRGASDRTGCIVSTVLGRTYRNWTNADGIMSADPRIVDDARTVGELVRREVREGANGGSGVLQGDTLVDVDPSPIEVYVLNPFNADGPHTRIVRSVDEFKERELSDGRPVVAVAGRENVAVMTIDDLGMADAVGYVEKITKKMTELGLSYANSPTAEDFVSFIFHREQGDEAKFDQLEDFVRANLLSRTSGHVELDIDGYGAVTLVGESLRKLRLNSSTVIRTLGTAGVHNITAVPLSSLKSPSSAFLVERDATKDNALTADKKRDARVNPTTVERLIQILHRTEIGLKSRLL